MSTILSAAGRAALRDGLIAFLALAAGILNAPNLNQAAALAGAASIAALIAAVRALRVFVPGLAAGLAKVLHVPDTYAEVAITALTTLLVGFITLAVGVLSAPDLATGKAAGVAGLLAIGTALVRVAQGVLTPGEHPNPEKGINTPEGG
jgi:putative effector of murein hydrolase LrgA (UPF0299 family)